MRGPNPGIEVLRETAMDSSTECFVMRPTCNQRSVKIEDLVARRKHTHVQMLTNQLHDLRDVKPPTLLGLVQDILAAAKKEDAATYNDDAFFRMKVAEGLDLCNLVKLLGSEFENQPNSANELALPSSALNGAAATTGTQAASESESESDEAKFRNKVISTVTSLQSKYPDLASKHTELDASLQQLCARPQLHRGTPDAGLEVLCTKHNFRRYQSGQPTVFSGDTS